jgi:two-component system, NtrC family, sensor kinase
LLLRLDIKLILSLTVLIVAISGIGRNMTLRRQKDRRDETMILGADQLSRRITTATWHATLADDRIAAMKL